MEFAVSRHRWSLKLVGIWPNNRDSLADLRFVITFVLITLVVIPQLNDLYQSDNFDKNVIKNLSTSIPCILVLLKLVMMRLNVNKLGECLNGMSEDWQQDWQPELKEKFTTVMMRNAKIGRNFNVACNVLFYITSLGFLILPWTVPGARIEIFEGNNITTKSSNNSYAKLPVSAIYFYNAYRSTIYELTYVSQCLGIVIGATANFSIDSFLALLVLHFCGQLEILGKSIELYYGIKKHDDNERFYKGCCSCVTCIVQRHLRIIRFSQMLEESFNFMLLLQLCGNSIQFCFLGYQIIMNFEDSEAIGSATFLVFMLSMMFLLFLYSYVGEELMGKSEAIGDSAYKAIWYDLETKASKPLIILMARSKTPIRITAGKFVVMSLKTYTDILKTSATYLSVLRAVRE